ncbi:unnamed protein product [Rotaria magnacalcarata]|uniref:Uncharacterized protein n=1 Tax=Rotaria magnacalcarata TaxID=392030 RepID=A0A818WKW6_9BILA|nr:unnamed protein product [Rotaria magnacalcarata]
MLKPERVTFSADDDNFYQLTNSDQLNSVLNDSLVHYSTDFKKTDQPVSRSLNHSNSLDQLPSTIMSSQEQQHHHPPPPQQQHHQPPSPQQQQQRQQQIEHEPLASSSIISEEIQILNETNLRQFDALTLQQLAVGSPENLSNINEQDTKTSPTHSISYADIQKEVDRVRQMKYNRTYSSPTSSLCSRLTVNPFNGSNNNIDLSSITQSVHFTEQLNHISHLPFSSTFITSIPESIVPASSSSTDGNHFIPISHIESPSLEDREVFETFHTKQTSIPGIAIRQSVNSITRNISASETDLIASLDRSASKQGIDNQSEHGTTYSGVSDDVIFLEWDKERNLFQDYINSLRTEIRVLLQERSEYQKNIETINNNLSQHKHVNLTQINIDQTKLELLKKSLEEKNLVLEQLQKEYETVKEKNSNLARKISVLRCDAKSQSGVIDELKQKITELTVDLQNHIIVKRRLEISMMNLENDCKIIDAERIRLTNDVKDTKLSKQDLEKLLQQANVQIAEQGSTIEMLRSDNIQVRSQLSTTQRRMLQEKQQVMDYLRQIENDLIEKEQIKQRESILRKDFDKLQLIHKQDRQDIEKLNLQIDQDKQKLDQLEQERLQLFKTIQNIDDNKGNLETELDSYKSAAKRLYTYFKIPFDSIHSIDQLIPMLEDRYRTEQVSQARIHDIQLVKSATDTNHEHETEEIRQLREDLLSMNIQLKQLNDVNQAWQQYQQNQIILLRDRLNLTNIDNLSFDDIAQQIENRFNILNNELIELQDVKKTTEIQAVSALYIKDDLYQSKDTQTEDAQEYKPTEKDESAEILIQQLTTNSKQYEEELRELRENLATLTTQTSQLDEANQAWQQYHRTQLDNFRNKLQPSLPIEIELSLDDIAQYIANYLDQMQNERENLREQLQTSENLINDLRSQSTDNILTTQENFASTINELNQKLLLIKQQNDQLETEKFILNQQILNQESSLSKHETKPSAPDSTLSGAHLVPRHTDTPPVHESEIHSVMPVQSASPLTIAHDQELAQLRETVTILTAQCAQLDEANRAWQQYNQTQVQDFQSKLKDYLPLDQNTSLDSSAEQIIEQILKTKEDFNVTNEALREEIVNIRLESGTNLETIKESYLNTINELNQELLTIKNQYESLDTEKQRLAVELENRTLVLNPDQSKQNIERISSNSLQRSFDEVSIHSSGATCTEDAELGQLRETVALLTTQCAQLDEANRAWQQYHQTQVQDFRCKLRDYFSLNENISLDYAAEHIIEQISKEREAFNGKYEALEKVKENLELKSRTNLEAIKESYVNAIEELNQELVVTKSRCEQLDAEKQRLSDELERRTSEFDRDRSRQNVERVSSNLLQQSFEEVPIHSIGATRGEMVECAELRETVAVLTAQCAQLDEGNRASQQYRQTQVQDILSKLQDFVSADENTSLDTAVERIVEQISKERAHFHERCEGLLEENVHLRKESKANADAMQNTYQAIIDGINEELVALKKQCEEWKIEKQYLTDELEKRSVPLHQEHVERNIEKVPSNLLKQSFAEVPIHTSSMNVEGDVNECQQLREIVASLTAQCAQLGEANQAWQMYQHTQFQEFRNKLQDYLSVDDNASFDTVAQQIIDKISREREDFHNKYEALVKEFDALRTDMTVPAVQQSEMNTVNEFNDELTVIKEAYEKLYAEKQLLMDQIESFSVHTEPKQDIEQVSLNILKEPSEQVPLHTSSVDVRDDIEELQKTIAHLTSECAQLDEANRTWQIYKQTQLDDFRNKLQDYISMDEHISFDDVIHKIIERIAQDRETLKAKCADFDRFNDYLQSESTMKMQLTEQPSTDYIDALNQELAILRNQNEELDRINKHLVFDNENLSNQLNDRSIVLGHHTVSDLNQIPEENTDELKENSENQSSSAPVDAEEMEKFRADLTSITDQFNQLIQTNKSELDSFRDTLQNWISLPENSTLDDIAQQLKDQFEQNQQNVPHTTENQTQTIELTERIHIAIETTPVIYENHQTQIDLVEMNDEETQTESFQQLWPIFNDDNLYNHDEDDNNLLDYIDEISSLSPTDLTDRLNKECQQILIKQNLSLSSYDNLQLNHYALMAIYLLYKQHLTDDAKQLYNETLIRALRQEYELINNEKHDYMEKYNEAEENYLNKLNLNEKKMHQLQNKYEELLEHNELERLDSKKLLNDLAEKYEFNLYNLHQENENLKYNLSNLSQSREKSLGNDQNQLQSEYQQLRQDYDELISENELLKDYNSQMYQRKLQRNTDDQDSDEMVSLHDIDIQCNLSDERQASNNDESSWSNNWADEKIQQEKLVQEQKSTEDDEINRLKSIISDIQLENENLKELNAELYQIKLQYTNTDSMVNESIIKSQDIDIQCLLQPITVDSFVQTEHENEQNEPIQIISSVTEDNDWNNNDWNDQIPITEIPLGEPNVSSITVEHKMPETVDNETQTDQQTQDKLSQINDKLKRALQTIKDRIHQIVIEQPELFSNTNHDTLERLDHLIIIIRNQAMQINDLQNSYDQAQDEINQMQSSLEARQDHIDSEHVTKTEELAFSSSSVNDRSQSATEDSEKQIHQLQQKLSQNDDEKLLLRERLNEVELELRKVLDDHTSTRAMYEEQLQSLITERDAIVEQQALQSNENQHQIQKLEDELAQVKQSVDSAHADTTSNEDVKSLQEIIQEQSDEMKDLSEKYFTLVSQLEVQDEILKQKHQTEEQLKIYEKQIQHLINEHAALSDELQKKTSYSVSNIDNESQTDEQQQQQQQQQNDKLVQLNHKLKRALQTFKDKIHRLVTERPELFTDVGEETTERFDHLIATVEHQAAHIDLLQSENEQSQEQLRNQIQELQSSLDACRYQLENERPVQGQQLVCATPPSDEISQTKIENYERQIHQLQQKLSQNDDEKLLLRERLNEVELELRKVLDEHASTTAMYEKQLQSLIIERDALVEQHALQSADKQENSPELMESFIGQHDANEENQSLKEIIRQQAELHRELDEKFIALTSSQIESQAEFDKQKKEIEEQMNNYKNQIQNLSLERTNLLEELQKNTASPVQSSENEKRTDDKLVKVNTKLKRALQTFKDKIHRLVTERPELFTDVGEETTERFDHLIATVEHQAAHIDLLQSENEQSQEQLRNQIQELQSSLDACRYQLENERPVQGQQLVCATPPSDEISQTKIENYEKQIHQLQQKLSQNDDEKILLRERLNEVELELRKVLDEHASTTAMYEEQLQSLIIERDAIVEQQIFQSNENQHEMKQLREELDQLKQLSAIQQSRMPTEEYINSLHETIEQQSEQLKRLNENFVTLTSSQLESQTEFDRQKKEIDERISNYENQLENLSLERKNLLEELQKNTASPVQSSENEKQKNDQLYEKLLKVNNKLKRVLQTFKDRIHRIATERSDLFTNVGEETSERLDHLIDIVESQAVQMETLQTERFELQREINELKNSFDVYRQEIDNDYRMKLSEFTASSAKVIQDIESEPIEQKRQTSNENQWNDWSADAPIIADDEKQFRNIDIQCELLADNDPSTINKPTDHYESTAANHLLSLPKNEISSWSETTTNDWEEQSSPIKFPSEESHLVEHMISSSSTNQNLLEILKTKLNKIISEYPEIFPNINRDTFDALDQLNSIIRNFQNQIKELQSSFDAYRYRMENEPTVRANELASSDVFASTSGLTTPDEYQKEIDQLKEQIDQNNLIHQREIQYLIEERDQAREQIQINDKNSYKSSHSTESQASLNIDCSLAESRLSDCQSQIDVLLRERISLMEQIKQLAHQSNKQHSEIKTAHDNESSAQPEQRISRRVFEQEILAWSKESEQLKQFVKQIQVENKKLKDIILKFESIIQDYMHENELLKQENQHLSFLSYSSKQIAGSNENSTSSDMDICYLTLKWLTYEVAQRTSNNNEQSSLIIDDNESYLKQRLYDSERQVKTIRIQNQKLKKQLETYTIQFKHIQHEMSIKIQELSTLKIEIERLRTSETQYRLEVDRLKTDIHCNQVKFQQIERELTDVKLKRTNNNNDSANNLRELLELKERELHALKEKLDYTIQTHQLELQESIKANQFSLDNVQRFEQLDQRHQEKRKELEIRLGKICKSIKPLIDNQHLFKENSIIDFDELQDLITDTEAEQRVTTSLGPIRDCLGLLESQMKELQHNLIENHARRSQRWKYKLGFECLSCESRWEVTHDVQDLQEACQDPTMFLESSRVEPMTGCSCPLIVDFIETDVRLCIDDILDEVIVRTTVA